MSTDEPKLAKPGAGLPFFEHLLLRHWLFPRYVKKSTWTARLGLFLKEGEKIVALAKTAGPAIDRQRRVLIERVRGMEDSSRHWSVDMTIEHLTIVGNGMHEIISTLLAGGHPTVEADTAKVKPTGVVEDGVDRLAAYELFLASFRRSLTDPTTAGAPTAKHPHPWLGPLTAGEWLAIAALHQRTHRLQIEAILAGLKQAG